MRLLLPVVAVIWAIDAVAATPSRVVSMNLCTDQLALMLAAEGQLVSVSSWATRPAASNMAEAAQALEVHAGSAEQIFLLKPDLVLAGTFTSRATVDMLRRLGLRVELFPPAGSLADVTDMIHRMGSLLGREAAAAAVVGAFEGALDAEADRARGLEREDAAYHYANNYTSGADTLAAEVLARASFDNAAARLGLTGAARLDLETLVMTRPFLVRTDPISGASIGRSYETATHPALAALGADGRSATLAQRWQVCGTPFVVRAITALLDARLGSTGTGERE
jgi:iron complex transport system substrate-binding protein